ncbi:MAG: DUF92 domain-containing protein, partial [Thermoanaerobaculum sp.]|nr:DUF92 domain-containing protein [Thermoanaerobaculum sp.]
MRGVEQQESVAYQRSGAPRSQRLPAGELGRKAVHAGMGLFALLLPWLTSFQAALCAVAAFLFNWQILPRILGHRFRTARQGSGDAGVLLYPVVVLVLILSFRHRLELAAFGWGVLAFGDALAGVVGQRWGRRPLPWNQEKTWEGFAAFVVGGLVGAASLAAWYGAVRDEAARDPAAVVSSLAFWCAWGLVPCLLAGLLESLPHGLDDNVLPPLAAPVLGVLGGGEVGWVSEGDLWLGLLVNCLCALVALGSKVLQPSGVAAAWVLGVATWSAVGWRGFLLLLAFLLAGLAVTFVGFSTKKARGVAEPRQGRRGATQVL